LLAADLASKQIIPAFLIDDLFNQFDKGNEVLSFAKENLAHKKQSAEKDRIELSQKEKILAIIKKHASTLETIAPNSSNKKEKLEKILTDYSFSIKQKYYS